MGQENVRIRFRFKKETREVESFAVGAPSRSPLFSSSADGTEFAKALNDVAESAGFAISEDEVFDREDLALLIRGEHFDNIGDSEFYRKAAAWVRGGGTLFATSWVSWESLLCPVFREVLPCEHVNAGYRENKIVHVTPTAESASAGLWTEPFDVRTSYEKLVPRPISHVLLTYDGNPILCHHKVGDGAVYYLNSCQHVCRGSCRCRFPVS